MVSEVNLNRLLVTYSIRVSFVGSRERARLARYFSRSSTNGRNDKGRKSRRSIPSSAVGFRFALKISREVLHKGRGGRSPVSDFKCFPSVPRSVRPTARSNHQVDRKRE